MTWNNRIKLGAAVVAVVLVVIVIFQNTQNVQTRFLLARVEMPAALLLIVTLMIGFGVGAVATWLYLGRRGR